MYKIQSLDLVNNFHSQLFDPDTFSISSHFDPGSAHSAFHAYYI